MIKNQMWCFPIYISRTFIAILDWERLEQIMVAQKLACWNWVKPRRMLSAASFEACTRGSLCKVEYYVCSCFLFKGETNSVQFNSVAQSYLTLCDPMDWSVPGFPVHDQLLKFAQTHVHRVSDAIQLPHYLLSPSSPAFNLSQHQGLFQWVSSFQQVAKVSGFQLQQVQNSSNQ